MTKNVLMTGANGAFGLLTAKALLAAGHRVAAGMRAPLGRNAEAAARLQAAGAHVVEMDVTDEGSVQTGTDAALKALGRIDGLINMAGTGSHGLTEAFTPAQMLQLYDVNVVGVQRLMRAVLPGMRAQGSGLVINVSSLLGRLSLPFYGPYSATKFALESLSDTYRAELAPFGVDVVLVEPGGFATDFIGHMVHAEDKARLAGYGGFAAAPDQALQGYQNMLAATPAQDPAKVAQTMVQLLAAPAGTRPQRSVVDFLGMAAPVEAMNAQLAEVTAGVYQAIGAEALLTLKA